MVLCSSPMLPWDIQPLYHLLRANDSTYHVFSHNTLLWATLIALGGRHLMARPLCQMLLLAGSQTRPIPFCRLRGNPSQLEGATI